MTHRCESDGRYNFVCYLWQDGLLYLAAEEYETNVIICPFCGFQPERSKREDSQKCDMRCSEHCGNTVRDK